MQPGNLNPLVSFNAPFPPVVSLHSLPVHNSNLTAEEGPALHSNPIAKEEWFQIPPLRCLRLLLFSPSRFPSPPHGSGHFLTGRFTGRIATKALMLLVLHGFTGKKEIYAP